MIAWGRKTPRAQADQSPGEHPGKTGETWYIMYKATVKDTWKQSLRLTCPVQGQRGSSRRTDKERRCRWSVRLRGGFCSSTKDRICRNGISSAQARKRRQLQSWRHRGRTACKRVQEVEGKIYWLFSIYIPSLRPIRNIRFFSNFWMYSVIEIIPLLCRRGARREGSIASCHWWGICRIQVTTCTAPVRPICEQRHLAEASYPGSAFYIWKG